jgi:uncharacterized protein (TIGR02246 family)
MLLTHAPRVRCAEPAGKSNTSAKETAVTAELKQLSQEWYQAWIDKNAATVDRLMAADYVYIAANGQAQDRAALLRIIRSPGYRLKGWDRTNVVVRVLGDAAAVIRLRGQGEGEFDGKPFKEDSACLQVWSRVDGRWQLVLEQVTANKP